MRGSAHVEVNNQSWQGTAHYSWEIDWQDTQGWGVGFDDFFTGGTPGGSANQSTDGEVRSKFRWIPDYLNEPPSEKLNLLITALVWSQATGDASGVYRDPSEEHVDRSIIIDGRTTNMDPSTERDYINWIMQPATVNDVSAKHLVSIATNGQTEVWGPWIGLQASAGVDGGRTVFHEGVEEWEEDWTEYLLAYTIVGIAAESQVDSRSVQISRAGAINETVDSDGTRHGDTTYSYYDWGTNSASAVDNWQSFTANLGGDWSQTTNLSGTILSKGSSYTWSPTGGTFLLPDTWDHSDQWMDLGNLQLLYNGLDNYDYWDTLPSSFLPGSTPPPPSPPTTKTITYTVTDADGAKATASYILTVHEPVEKVNELVTPYSVQGVLRGSDPNGGSSGLLIVNGFTPANSISVSQGHAKSSGWTFGGELSFEKIKAPLGVSATYQSSHESNSTVTSSLPFDVPQDQYTYPMFEHSYNRHNVYYRHFLPEGEHRIPDQPWHELVWDDYAGGNIVWCDPVPNTTPYPVFNPQAPPPTLPEP